MPYYELDYAALRTELQQAAIGWAQSQPIGAYDIGYDGDDMFITLNPIGGERVELVIRVLDAETAETHPDWRNW